MFLVLVVWEQVVLGRYLRCFLVFRSRQMEIMWGQGCMWMIKDAGGGFIKLLVLLYAASCRLQVLWNFEFYRDCFSL